MSLLTNLISYWKLDEASGNALDAHGSNTLTDNNTVGSAAGKIGNARDFEKNNGEYFSIAHNSTLAIGDIDFTVCAWVQLESLVRGTIVAKDDSTNGGYYLLYNTSISRFQFEVYGGAGFTNAGVVVANNLGAPSTGTWYHIVAWHDSVNNQVGIAVNGGTPDTLSHSTGVVTGTGSFRIGGDSFTQLNGLYWDGLIDFDVDRVTVPV